MSYDSGSNYKYPKEGELRGKQINTQKESSISFVNWLTENGYYWQHSEWVDKHGKYAYTLDQLYEKFSSKK